RYRPHQGSSLLLERPDTPGPFAQGISGRSRRLSGAMAILVRPSRRKDLTPLARAAACRVGGQSSRCLRLGFPGCLYFGTAKASTMLFGVCLNSWLTAARAASARSCSGFDSTRLGYWTVTETSVPFLQLNPTCGRTPVDRSRSLSTAFACLKPSVIVLTASHAARVRAKIKAAAILNIVDSGVGASLSPDVDRVLADKIGAHGQWRISCAGQRAVSRGTIEAPFAPDDGEGSDESGLGAIDRPGSNRLDPESRAVVEGENWIKRKGPGAVRIVARGNERDGADCAVGKE